MAEQIREQRTVVQDFPNSGPVSQARPVRVETEYDHTVRERRGMSSGAIAAMVIGALLAAIIITMIIVKGQQDSQTDELALQRERAAAAERNAAAAQSAQQQPPVVVMPQTQQPAAVPYPVPVPTPSTTPSTATTPEAPSSVSIEVDVNSKFLEDAQLRSYPIIVKMDNGTATLTGDLPSDDLKSRAEKLALTVKGVKRVINDIEVKQ